jgi:hypothetical protein
MIHLPISDNAARQLIDSIAVFQEYQRVRGLARKFAGSMYWKHENGYEYLVKTMPRSRKQERIGPRSPQTELIFQQYTTQKTALHARTEAISQALDEAQRLNKALKVGRVPSLVIDILRCMQDAGLAAHFTVVGTHALYAYETAAGVRITPGALATQDVDLLWDARKRVKFMADMATLDASVLQVIQRADSTFVRKEGQNETAVNAKGFQVDFLRRQPEGDDPHPFRFSDQEGDLWPVQAVRASVLTSAPRFSQVVVAANGRMAEMQTIAPNVFVDFKRWLASQAKHREPIKQRRDTLQADIVQSLIDSGLLALSDTTSQPIPRH